MMTAAVPDPRSDRRRHAWREDLAAEALRGIISAPRYATGEAAQVVVPVAGLHRAPNAEAALDSEALLGARVTVYDRRDGWAWVQLADDGYVGYLPMLAISDVLTDATHRVAALASYVYPAADMKRPALMRLTLGARIAVVAMHGDYARLAGGGHVFARHLRVLDYRVPDFVAVAEQLIGVPYLWGGRTSLGCDCSGLVQLALEAAGIAAPRDSDMQAAELGAALVVGEDLGGLVRGDLVCWRGHIGIMQDADTLLHANAHHMMVASEPVAMAVRRIAESGARPIGFRRLL